MTGRQSALFSLSFFVAILPLNGSAAPVVHTSADIVLEKRLDPADTPDFPRYSEVIVAEGDSLHTLFIAAGVPPSEMDAALRLLRRLNPGIQDPHRIFPGQKLLLPSAASVAEAGATTGKDDPGAVEPPTSPDQSDPLLLSVLKGSGGLLPLIESSFGAMGESLTDEGSLLLPLASGKTVNLDNSRYPLLDLSTGKGLLLDLAGGLPIEQKRLIENRWPHYRFIDLPGDADLHQLVDAILDASDYYSVSRNDAVTMGHKSSVRIVSDFLVSKDSDSLVEGSLYLLNIENSSFHSLPVEIKEIARKHKIAIVEMYPGSEKEMSEPSQSGMSYRGGTKFTASGYRALIGELAPVIGLEVIVREGSMLLEGRGRSCVVSFGPRPAALSKLPEEKDIPSLPIREEDSFSKVFGSLLTFFGFDYSGPEIEFYRPEGRYTLTVSGFYFFRGDRPVLLTSDTMDPELNAFLHSRGIEVITCILP